VVAPDNNSNNNTPLIAGVVGGVGALLLAALVLVALLLWKRKHGVKKLVPPDFEKLAYGSIGSVSLTPTQWQHLLSLQKVCTIVVFILIFSLVFY
jgi:hypothetical protein